MIKKTRIKFIILGMLATIVVTAILILAINLVNAFQTDRILDEALQEVSATVEGMNSQIDQDEKSQQGYSDEQESNEDPEDRNDSDGQENQPGMTNTGKKDSGKQDNGKQDEGKQDEGKSEPGNKGSKSGQRRSAVNQYAGRYFHVHLAEDEVAKIDLTNQDLISEEEIISLVQTVLGKGTSTGYVDGFRYYRSENGGEQLIHFLDCTTELNAQRRLLWISVGVGLAGVIIAFVCIFLFSGKIIQPLKLSMEKQKQFITDAGHELKTPLSVIGTNMDILSMDLGENEWVDGTKKQVTRMRKLVNNLIALARIDEESQEMAFQKFDLSSAAYESVDPFAGIATAAGKELSIEIEDSLETVGDENQIRQLFTILCDNAVKYAESSEPIRVRLYKEGRKNIFETSNCWNREQSPEDLNVFFDRFYRADPSRNRKEGQDGYGLGLSIAKGIAERNHIQLTVSEDAQEHLVFRAVFS